MHLVPAHNQLSHRSLVSNTISHVSSQLEVNQEDWEIGDWLHKYLVKGPKNPNIEQYKSR